MKKILLIPSILFTVFTVAGCGDTNISGSGQTNKKADLKITYFNGGYGDAWITNMVARFEQANNVKVELNGVNEGNCGAEYFIKSGYNLSDIYIGECMPWQSLVRERYLADLTDVYEAEVETRNGKQKIKDFIDPKCLGHFYAQRQLKEAEYLPWAMPWSVQPNAMAYNEDILKSIRHISTIEVSQGVIGEDGKWAAAPKTYQDLLAFTEDCNAFNDNSAEKQALNDTHGYVPFGFAGGANLDSIGFPIITWWAEAQGLVTSNYENEGSFYDFFNFGNTTNSNVGQTVDLGVFRQSGLELAYNTFDSYFIDEQGNFKNTLSNPKNNNLQQLQQLFVANRVKEKPVLTIASSYLENEVIKNRYIDSDQDGKQDVNFKFMNVPKLYSESENLLYGRLSDSMIIPAKAAHVDLAKQFLIFICSEQEIDNFTKDTNGGIRPFNCDLRTETTGNEYSAFVNSLFDVYYNSNVFYEYPMNAPSLAGVSHVFRYSNPSYHGNISLTEILTVMQDTTKSNAGREISTAVISRLKQTELNPWISDYRLTNLTK